MKPPAELAAGSGDERRRALGSFIWQDRRRVLAVARRSGDRARNVIECELRGGSMTGAIPPRSRIRIVCGCGPYPVGQVIAFMNGGQVVVHRIVYRRRCGLRGEHLITRGDAMIVPDPPIDIGAVVGRVVEVRSDGCWRSLGPSFTPSCPERLLAFLALAASVAMLVVSPRLARRFVSWLQRAERRFGWNRTVLQ